MTPFKDLREESYKLVPPAFINDFSFSPILFHVFLLPLHTQTIVAILVTIYKLAKDDPDFRRNNRRT